MDGLQAAVLKRDNYGVQESLDQGADIDAQGSLTQSLPRGYAHGFRDAH